jgi:hypothetical protein
MIATLRRWLQTDDHDLGVAMLVVGVLFLATSVVLKAQYGGIA